MVNLKGAYQAHKGNAKRRGVPFLLTFEEWLDIWQKSGKLAQRGCRVGQYVMARYGDCGPYAVGNVRIATVLENHQEYVPSAEARVKLSVAAKEALTGRTMPQDVKIKISASLRGKSKSADHVEKVRIANKGKKRSPEFCAKMSAIASRRRTSEETRARMSLAQRRRRQLERLTDAD